MQLGLQFQLTKEPETPTNYILYLSSLALGEWISWVVIDGFKVSDQSYFKTIHGSFF